MNRRNFFKVVTGFVVGIFASSVEGKKRSGIRYCGEASTGIDPNSEWAKQKPLTLDMLIKVKEELDAEFAGREKIMYFPKDTYNLRYGIMV